MRPPRLPYTGNQVSTPAQRKPRPASFWILPIVLALGTSPARAYSQFTHEELIDLTWANTIRPLLLRRFPNSTDSDLRRAQSYAYGGCLIQDIGYYPFGKELFSDLPTMPAAAISWTPCSATRPRSTNLRLRLAPFPITLATPFGTPWATNPATAITFPDLRARYGAIVTYEEAPTGHVRTEFGFDVAQTARHRYAARRYRKRIGFRVSRLLLYRRSPRSTACVQAAFWARRAPPIPAIGGRSRRCSPPFSALRWSCSRTGFRPIPPARRSLIICKRWLRASTSRSTWRSKSGRVSVLTSWPSSFGSFRKLEC